MGKDQGKAFTLVELVIVIAIIGILAAIAIPRFIDIRTEAYRAQRDGIVGGARSGIMLVAAKNQVSAAPSADTFPPNLEAPWAGQPGGTSTPGKACGTGVGESPCFELVFSQPLIDPNWTETATANCYQFTPPVGALTKYLYQQKDGAGNFIGRFDVDADCLP